MSNNLAKSWMRIQVKNHGLGFFGSAQAINLIEKDTGQVYTQSRFGEWVRGVRPVPATLRPYFLKTVLPDVAMKYGNKFDRMNSSDVDNIVDMLI